MALILYVERWSSRRPCWASSQHLPDRSGLPRAVEELLRRTPRIQSPATPKPVPQRTGSQAAEIEARGLTLRYPNADRNTLEDVSFRLSPGELVAVVGPVGCGKTTLARALGRMVEVPQGQLYLDGTDITALDLEQLRQQVALVPQEGYLFTATLADNLRYGEPDADQSRVEQAAEQARLATDVRGFPDRYETLVGERGITLSGGQRQRTALGRALLVQAPLSCWTTPWPASTTTPRPRSGLAANRTAILMVSHQLPAAAACDRILVLDEGRLVQRGYNVLLEQPGTYRRLWERTAEEQLGQVA